MFIGLVWVSSGPRKEREETEEEGRGKGEGEAYPIKEKDQQTGGDEQKGPELEGQNGLKGGISLSGDDGNFDQDMEVEQHGRENHGGDGSQEERIHEGAGLNDASRTDEQEKESEKFEPKTSKTTR